MNEYKPFSSTSKGASAVWCQRLHEQVPSASATCLLIASHLPPSCDRPTPQYFQLRTTNTTHLRGCPYLGPKRLCFSSLSYKAPEGMAR